MSGLPMTLADLAPLPRWVAWQTELPEGRDKPTKLPYSPTKGVGKAHADKPHTWGAKVAAEARALRLPKPYGAGGIGLELGDLGDGRSLAGIDLDTCREPRGAIEPWAKEIIAKFGSYAEISPSETGAKLDFGHFWSGVDPEVRLGGDVVEGCVERHGFDAERP